MIVVRKNKNCLQVFSKNTCIHSMDHVEEWRLQNFYFFFFGVEGRCYKNVKCLSNYLYLFTFEELPFTTKVYWMISRAIVINRRTQSITRTRTEVHQHPTRSASAEAIKRTSRVLSAMGFGVRPWDLIGDWGDLTIFHDVGGERRVVLDSFVDPAEIRRGADYGHIITLS